MRKLVLFFVFTYFSALCIAQTYKYLGVEDGLSNRRVYAIQKGPKGYMWFLTHNGIDRYDGKNFKQYRLIDSEIEVNSMLNLSWLYVGTDGTLWEIGKKGRVFRYDAKHDRFQLVYKLPDEVVKGNPTPVSYGFIDSNNIVWLCNEEALYLYDVDTGKTSVIKNHIGESITDIEQIDSEHYFIGTDVGIHHAELKDNVLNLSPCHWLDNLKMQVNELYFHKESRKLFIGTFQKGLYLYDMNIHQAIKLNAGLEDVSITRIKAFNDKEILIATDGAGVYKMNVDSYKCDPYIVADYNSYNAMNGNSIYDLYVDGDRIWMANYPIGITVRNNQYASYQWIKHSIGNRQSLVNDQVNAIIEDHEGDLWFATNNGISLYSTQTKQWYSFLSVFDNGNVTKNHVFISLCEVSPGIIWAGGYSSGIYQINKKQMKAEFFTPSTFSDSDIRPDKYIRSIMKDSAGNIWSGGYYNLKQIDISRKNIRAYPGLNGITDIIEKDEKHMWIGTATGLYLLDKESGEFQYISMPIESFYINALYQSDNGLLYIGTSNSGLLIYDYENKSFEHFHKDNCPLISNNIYTILSDEDQSILLSTENSLTSYYPSEKVFHNWTKEQGLKSDHFNSASGVLRKNGNFILGSTDGAIEFHKDMMIPRNYKFQMIFSDLRVFYQTVYPGDEGSPLEVDIDETKVLKLKYNQNIFSLRISSINYDYPSLILYSWKLEGFYDGWSRPEKDCLIRFTNLNPGKYTLRVRAISSEDRRIVLEERDMDIMIEQPIWLSIWALLLYALVIAAIVTITLRVIILRKQRKTSDEKIRFFINTAHDIRTPLTLIKAPLEELSEKEDLTPGGRSNMNTAIRNVNALLRLTTNLINFERADTYSSALYVSEYELSTYMEEMINAFRAYADVKRVSLTYESNFRYMNVWLDKDKMDSILKNLISNALKYTPEGGSVHIFTAETEYNWSVEVKDTGESGVPKNISLSTVYDTARQRQQQNDDLPKILIVEDNDELREYLRNTLSDDYTIQVCSDGKQALDIVKEYMPNMVISDIMMPGHKLKNDIETSHIPIILLTALNNDRNIIEGLKTGADEYIVKPFNIGILRATIANILTNRSLLRHKYANLELNDEESDTACINCSTDIDWKFISTVKKSVEDNMDNSSFTVDVLCNLLNMSRTSFYNKIKALTDQAPADYIRLIRLKRAAQLLKEQQHSITEVAEMTGFSDAKYFREVFKKHFNVSPSQYAKQKEEDNNGKMI